MIDSTCNCCRMDVMSADVQEEARHCADWLANEVFSVSSEERKADIVSAQGRILLTLVVGDDEVRPWEKTVVSLPYSGGYSTATAHLLSGSKIDPETGELKLDIRSTVYLHGDGRVPWQVWESTTHVWGNVFETSGLRVRTDPVSDITSSSFKKLDWKRFVVCVMSCGAQCGTDELCWVLCVATCAASLALG